VAVAVAIEAFWKLFVEKLSVLDDDDLRKAAMDELLVALERVDQRLHFHIGHHDAGKDLLISAEGHYELGETVESIAAAAPAVPGWDYLAVLDSSVAFGERSKTLFPDDATGDVLWGLVRDGDRPWRRRFVDFEHVFATQEQATGFSSALDDANQVSPRKDGKWDVTVKRPLVARYDAIAGAESQLGDLAKKFGGEPDGWGCWPQNRGNTDGRGSA
jgi:hypothetical protein